MHEYDLSFQAIHGYRETERSRWTQNNKRILQKVGDLAFPPGKPQITYVHVLDLAKEGHIKAHIDSVRVGLGMFIESSQCDICHFHLLLSGLTMFQFLVKYSSK